MSELRNELFVFIRNHNLHRHVWWKLAFDFRGYAAFTGFQLRFVHAFVYDSKGPFAEPFTEYYIPQFLFEFNFGFIQSAFGFV